MRPTYNITWPAQHNRRRGLEGVPCYFNADTLYVVVASHTRIEVSEPGMHPCLPPPRGRGTYVLTPLLTRTVMFRPRPPSRHGQKNRVWPHPAIFCPKHAELTHTSNHSAGVRCGAYGAAHAQTPAPATIVTEGRRTAAPQEQAVLQDPQRAFICTRAPTH